MSLYENMYKIEDCRKPDEATFNLLRAEVERLANDTQAELLLMNGKIAETVVYIREHLTDTVLETIGGMKDDGELEAIIVSALSPLLARIDKKTEHIVSVKEFGATGNGATNDICAIEEAIASLNPGDTLVFPKGVYLMEGNPVVINKPRITFTGEGIIVCDYGFRVRGSYFKAIGLTMLGGKYSTDCRAFMIDNETPSGGEPIYLEGFTFKDCSFTDFFYSVYASGGAYNYDGTEAAIGYPVRDVVIENCYSSTYEDKNAGHFQCIQVENISYINNRTYGGQNATSYNAIKGNGYIRVIGNYDHNNSYGSTEIENGSGHVVIANNTFGSKIWVDDSFDVVVNGNVTNDSIHVTVGSNNGDAENVVVSNNVCKNIRCEQFGNYQGGLIKHVNIIGNTVNGDNTHGIWMHGNAVTQAKIADNFICGTNTNDIAIQRNAQLECFIHNNFGSGKLLLIAGSGGKVFALDNYNITVSGNRDSLPASHLEREFNGLKVTDTTGVAWRVNVNTSGEVFSTKY